MTVSPPARRRPRRALVLVQGDVGRSPRMQYHALALAAHDVHVDLVGFAGVDLPPALEERSAIACHRVIDPPASAGGTGVMAARALARGVRLARALAALPPPDLVLMQSPPAVPAGPLAWMLARLRGARLVIDWHNFGWTLLALKSSGVAVGLLREAEGWLARRGDAHLCVSHALAAELEARWAIDAQVLYDRAPDWFRPGATDHGRALRARVIDDAGLPVDRTVLIVSPTSWTRDEDVGIIIEAADRAGAQLGAQASTLPPVLLLVTGQGPGRAAFEGRLADRPRDAPVAVRTGWVDHASYPALLAACDAGLSVHRSSSGADLPMKVADMFGAGVPVLALAYRALAERVQCGANGLLFDDAAGLARLIVELWTPTADAAARRAALKAASIETGRAHWMDGWNAEAAPTLM